MSTTGLDNYEWPLSQILSLIEHKKFIAYLKVYKWPLSHILRTTTISVADLEPENCGRPISQILRTTGNLCRRSSAWGSQTTSIATLKVYGQHFSHILRTTTISVVDFEDPKGSRGDLFVMANTIYKDHCCITSFFVVFICCWKTWFSWHGRSWTVDISFHVGGCDP